MKLTKAVVLACMKTVLNIEKTTEQCPLPPSHPPSLSLPFSSFKPNKNFFTEGEAQSHQEKGPAEDLSKSFKFSESHKGQSQAQIFSHIFFLIFRWGHKIKQTSYVTVLISRRQMPVFPLDQSYVLQFDYVTELFTTGGIMRVQMNDNACFHGPKIGQIAIAKFLVNLGSLNSNRFGSLFQFAKNEGREGRGDRGQMITKEGSLKLHWFLFEQIQTNHYCIMQICVDLHE